MGKDDSFWQLPTLIGSEELGTISFGA